MLDRRTGLPITLSVIAIAVGTRAGLAVAGVGLPGHFIAKAAARGEEIYFDPFHGGRVLSVADCEALVERVVGGPFQATPAALAAAPVGAIIQRMLNNLKGVYLEPAGFYSRRRASSRCLSQLAPRDAASAATWASACCTRAGPAPAIDPLNAYLSWRAAAGGSRRSARDCAGGRGTGGAVELSVIHRILPVKPNFTMACVAYGSGKATRM